MKYTLFLLFSLITFVGLSQDKILKTNDEEIFCQITKIGSDSIWYNLPFKDVTEINYSIARSEVKMYYLNVNEGTLNNVNNDYVREFDEPVAEIIKPLQIKRPKLTIGVNGGFSYLLAAVVETDEKEVNDYYKELKTGYHIGGDAHYFFSKWIGLGVEYSSFKTENSIDGTFIFDNGVIRTGTLYDKIKSTYIGPSFAFRIFLNKKNSSFRITHSFGYLNYQNKSHYIEPVTLKGSTFGMGQSIGYDLQLEKHLFLTIKLAIITGVLTSAEIETSGTKQQYEYLIGEQPNISRFDLSVGIRFGK